MDDDSDDSSQVETLDQFREKWHKELIKPKRNQKQTTKNAIPLSSTNPIGCTNAVDDDKKLRDNQVNKHSDSSFSFFKRKKKKVRISC